jgi:arylsulfatase A-like enzyme
MIAAPGMPSLPERFLEHGFSTGAITSRIALNPRLMGIPGFAFLSVPRSYNTSAREAYRRAMNWLSDHRRESVFLWVHFFDPHQPYEWHRGYTKRFGRRVRAGVPCAGWLRPGQEYTPEEIQDRINYYDGELAFMDHYLGKLLEGLRQLQPASQRPPLILVVADHGEMLAEKQGPPLRLGFAHGGVLYEGVVRIPLIVSWPGTLPALREVKDVVEVVDLAPTLTELLWGEEFKCQGQSLVKRLKGRPLAPDQGPAFLQRDKPFDETLRPFLRLDQYAVVRWPDKLFITMGGEVELYDLALDPEETRDRAQERQEVVEELKVLWEAWAQRTPQTMVEEKPASPSEIQTLRALGYLQ